MSSAITLGLLQACLVPAAQAEAAFLFCNPEHSQRLSGAPDKPTPTTLGHPVCRQMQAVCGIGLRLLLLQVLSEISSAF